MDIKLNKIVGILNDLYKLDPAAADVLICLRVPVNTAVRDHPTIQVLCKNTEGTYPTLGILGIINGFISETGQVIVADFDVDKHTLVGFRLTDLQSQKPPCGL